VSIAPAASVLPTSHHSERLKHWVTGLFQIEIAQTNPKPEIAARMLR
jgi:hypothetical protein